MTFPCAAAVRFARHWSVPREVEPQHRRRALDSATKRLAALGRECIDLREPQSVMP